MSSSGKRSPRAEMPEAIAQLYKVQVLKKFKAPNPNWPDNDPRRKELLNNPKPIGFGVRVIKASTEGDDKPEVPEGGDYTYKTYATVYAAQRAGEQLKKELFGVSSASSFQ